MKATLCALRQVKKGLVSMPTGTFSNYSVQSEREVIVPANLREEARNEARR